MSQINNQTPNTGEILKVLYDGECPMCRKEIAHVKGLAEKTPHSGLCFVDISCNSPESVAYAADKSKLLDRFHVEHMDGSRVDGAKAFVAMWDRLPGWRWLAKISRIPGVLKAMEISYNGFLKIRPSIQNFVRRWVK